MKRKDTAFFQQRLADALIRLMQRSPFHEITISEVVAEADVARATFYRHFQTKDDLLVYHFNQLTAAWRAESDLSGKPFEERAIAYMEFLLQNRDFITMLADSGKLDILERYLVGIVVKNPTAVYDRYREFGSAYFFLGIVSVWIDRGFADSPKELMDIMLRAVEARP